MFTIKNFHAILDDCEMLMPNHKRVADNTHPGSPASASDRFRFLSSRFSFFSLFSFLSFFSCAQDSITTHERPGMVLCWSTIEDCECLYNNALGCDSEADTPFSLSSLSCGCDLSPAQVPLATPGQPQQVQARKQAHPAAPVVKMHRWLRLARRDGNSPSRRRTEQPWAQVGAFCLLVRTSCTLDGCTR
jgi:hypothetical protein